MNNTTQANQNPITLQSDDGNSPCYIIGKIKPYFPTIDLQQEYQGAVSLLNLKPENYYQVFSYQSDKTSPLAFRNYRYIAEQVYWIVSINNIDSFIAVAKTEQQLDSFINSLQAQSPNDSCVLIGAQPSSSSTISSTGQSGDINLPIIVCDHLLAPCQNITDAIQKFQIQPNLGLSSTERAINYMLIEFTTLSEQQKQLIATPAPTLVKLTTKTLTVKPHRDIIEIILTYQNDSNESTQDYHCAIDVTDTYPFIEYALTNYVPKQQ